MGILRAEWEKHASMRPRVFPAEDFLNATAGNALSRLQ